MPSVITVEYRLNDKIYELKENLVMKKEKNIILGFIPIGYKTKSQIELFTGTKVIVGNKVRIKYTKSNSNHAYLVDNEGKLTMD